MTRLGWIRVMLGIVVAGLVVAGVTAFPLEWELGLAAQFAHATGLADVMPGFVEWIDRVHEALVESYGASPFLAYGTDWLAYAHLVIAVAFVMAMPDPVRNVLVVRWGLVMCAAIVPLALIAGPIRGIPWGWTAIDLAFGVLAAIPLTVALVLIRRERRREESATHARE